MRFGKITYLNLLPFAVFFKRQRIKVPQKESFPAKLNVDFLRGGIEAGFISSIAAMRIHNKARCAAGIISKGAVKSVLCLDAKNEGDLESASSNALKRVLKLKGKVIIGDRALKLYYQKSQSTKAIDLGEEWSKRHNLPFVFGLMCAQKRRSFYKKLGGNFAKSKIKIPSYIIKEASSKSELKVWQILKYLEGIHYEVGPKELLGLFRFYRSLRIMNIKPPSRF